MRKNNELFELFRTVPGLHGLDDRNLSKLYHLVDHDQFNPGDVLTHEGTPGRQAFIVVEGSGTVTVHGEPVASIGPGQFVGEMSLLDHRPRCATARADTPMHVLVIGPRDFATFIDHPQVAQAMALQLTDRLRKLEASPV